MWNPASANLTFDFFKTVLHHGHIITEYFDLFLESYFTLIIVITCEACLFINEPN